ncbi:putative pyrophosphatase PpaX [Diadema setosum]|uniref:putative pyrophosphatase PpaX n=1 Tax=Diadema setosum TaxID=31175 RepID=UPI003B3B9D39
MDCKNIMNIYNCNNNDFSLRGGPQESGVRKVAIFDKDGTLTCMHSLWGPWLSQVAKRLENVTGMRLQEEIFKAMGFDSASNTFGPGILMEQPNRACFEYLHALLQKKGVPKDRAHRIVTSCYDNANALLSGELVEFGDVQGIFTRLKDEGYYIAVDTADSRIVTEGTLDRLGVAHLVDVIVCGNDPGVVPKPHAFTALKICAKLGVEPKNAVFIGDTPTDAMCGRNSNCGLVISVLTGGVDRRLLEDKADFVVESIEEAADLILSRAC